jgi:predicted esterase
MAAPGELVKVELDRSFSPAEIDEAVSPLFEGYERPAATHGVDVYYLHFESRYPDGSAATVRSQLFMPRGGHTAGPGESERDLYLFGPGSTGILDVCRPSREHIAGIYWGSYRDHTLSFAGNGFIGLLPDYMGFGDPSRLQPFFHAEAGTHLMLDGVRAVRNFLATRSGAASAREVDLDQVFLAGYSQGGHAAFAAADYRDSYAPEVSIDGIIGYGPTTDMRALIQEFTVVGPLVAYSFRERYGVDRFDPARMLQDPWLESLDYDVTRQCIGGIQSYYSWSPEEMYRPAFLAALRNGRLDREYPRIAAILDEHSVGLSGHGVSALIVQGTDDIVVYPDSQTEFVTKLRGAGSDVRYYIYENERHDVRQAAHMDVLNWIRNQQ